MDALRRPVAVGRRTLPHRAPHAVIDPQAPCRPNNRRRALATTDIDSERSIPAAAPWAPRDPRLFTVFRLCAAGVPASMVDRAPPRRALSIARRSRSGTSHPFLLPSAQRTRADDRPGSHNVSAYGISPTRHRQMARARASNIQRPFTRASGSHWLLSGRRRGVCAGGGEAQ